LGMDRLEHRRHLFDLSFGHSRPHMEVSVKVRTFVFWQFRRNW
jgi:hypothetical protein